MKAKRTYKDSLFRDIFRDKDRLAELYYALTGETAHSVDIKITTLKDTVFSSVKNDLSFRVGDRHIILIEHQSTLNENMPLRMLLYLAQMYQKDVPSDLIYREARVPLPAPQFYVFYNGEKYEVPRQGTTSLRSLWRGTRRHGTLRHRLQHQRRCRTRNSHRKSRAQELQRLYRACKEIEARRCHTRERRHGEHRILH